MGPFSLVNPNNGLSITVEGLRCSSGMALTPQVDDPNNQRQQFYLGQHGSIFSLFCPGLVLSVSNSTDTDGSYFIQLEVFHLNDKKMKWRFLDGMIESVFYPGMVIEVSVSYCTLLNFDEWCNTQSISLSQVKK